MSIDIEEIFVSRSVEKFLLKLKFNQSEESFYFDTIEKVNSVLSDIFNQNKMIVIDNVSYLLKLHTEFSIKSAQANLDLTTLDENFTKLTIYGEDSILNLPDTIHAQKVSIRSKDQSIFETPLFPSSSEVSLKFDTIYTINPESFPFVKKLDLSNNQIQELSDAFQQVVEINLSNNQIEELVSFPKADVVNLNHNRISTVDEGIFPLATEVELAENRLKTLTGNIFPNTEYLDLNHNQIKYISSEVLQNVIQLDLSYNQMSYIPEMPNIAELDVQSNKIEDLGKMPSSLEVINLSQNPIRNLQKIIDKRDFRVIFDQSIQPEKQMKFNYPIDVRIKSSPKKMDVSKIIPLQSMVRRNLEIDKLAKDKMVLEMARKEIEEMPYSNLYNYGNIDIENDEDVRIYWYKTKPILEEIIKGKK